MKILPRVLLALLALGAVSGAAAQSYPAQPIRMISPFPPGGSVDIMARLIVDPLAHQLNGRVFVENRSGASGNIGMEAVARAPADGYTIVLNTIPLVTNVSLFDKLTWDPIRDFAPIGMVATGPHVLVVPTRVEAKNVDELIRLAKASPGKLSYASAGSGTTFHFCAEIFKDLTGTDIVHIPYKGGGPALVDTLSGQVDMSFPTLSAALPHIKAGKLRALAQTDNRRSALLSDVPTLDEAGVKGFQFTQWLALLAPAATPQPVIARLSTSLKNALGTAELREKFAQQGFEPFVTSPEEAGRFLAGEVGRYAKLIKTRKITAQ